MYCNCLKTKQTVTDLIVWRPVALTNCPQTAKDPVLNTGEYISHIDTTSFTAGFRAPIFAER